MNTSLFLFTLNPLRKFVISQLFLFPFKILPAPMCWQWQPAQWLVAVVDSVLVALISFFLYQFRFSFLFPCFPHSFIAFISVYFSLAWLSFRSYNLLLNAFLIALDCLIDAARAPFWFWCVWWSKLHQPEAPNHNAYDQKACNFLLSYKTVNSHSG